jgi:hypothetical protein
MPPEEGMTDMGWPAGPVVPPGSVLLDNLTLQSAFRALSAPHDGLPVVDRPRGHAYRGDKWNYALNGDFRVAIDIACLAQLLQAIVLNERIALDPDFMFRWGAGVSRPPDRDAAITLPDEARGLEEIIVPLAYDDDLHRAMLTESSGEALAYTATAAFRDYLGLLSHSGVEGAILDITNGYFSTGYSDPSALPIFTFNTDAADPAYFKLASEASADEDNSAAIRLYSFLNNLRDATPDDHALISTHYAPSDVYDKVSAASDVIKHAAAAGYFQRLAALADASYMPHPLRSSFVLFEQVCRESPDSALRQRVIVLAESIHAGRVASLSDRFGLALGDVPVPFVLAAALQSARSPADILQRALEMRESKAACRLRGWFTSLHAELTSGQVELDSLERRLDDLDRLLRRWLGASSAEPDAGSSRKINIGVNIGLVSVSTDLDLRKAAQLVSSRRQLRFLHDLTRVANVTPGLDPLLQQVFGQGIAGSWRRSRKAMVQFSAPPSSREYRSLLDIR